MPPRIPALALAALFLIAGMGKLQDPEVFAYALKALELGLSNAQLARLAFVLPWFELTLAVALLLPAWRRAAAALATLLMLGFMLSIASLMLRGIDLTCPCFGSLTLVCRGPLGPCHLLRNLLLAGMAGWLWRRTRPNAAPASSS